MPISSLGKINLERHDLPPEDANLWGTTLEIYIPSREVMPAPEIVWGPVHV